MAFCEDLGVFPHRGRACGGVGSRLRTIGFKRRAAIAFAVLGQTVVIVGVFYGGRDYEAVLGAEAHE